MIEPIAAMVWGSSGDSTPRAVREEKRIERFEHALHGERAGGVKLTEEDVRAIRADLRSGRTLAKVFNISNTVIWDIKRRKIWKHVQ